MDSNDFFYSDSSNCIRTQRFFEPLASNRPESDDEGSVGSDWSVLQHSPQSGGLYDTSSEFDALSDMDVDMDNVQHPKSEVKSEAPSPARQRKTKSPRHSDVKDNASHSTSTSVAAAAGAWEKNWAEPGRSESLRHVRCLLEDRDFWREFDKLGTEMIITKSGRRMFPAVKVRFEGCNADAIYYVLMDVVPVDNHRYRYVYNKSAWQQAGKAEPNPPSRLYKNPDCPYTGKQLTTQTVTFETANLTNNDVGDGKEGHFVLNSMHKYIPRIHLVRRDRYQTHKIGTAPGDLAAEKYWTFSFKETEFMAVTAYQNQLVTQLKISRNPFAKGFRDPLGRTDRISDPLSQFMTPPMTPTGFQFAPAAVQQLPTSMLNSMLSAAAAIQSASSFAGGRRSPSVRLSGRVEDAHDNSSSAFNSDKLKFDSDYDFQMADEQFQETLEKITDGVDMLTVSEWNSSGEGQSR